MVLSYSLTASTEAINAPFERCATRLICCGRLGDHRVSDRGQTDQAGDEGRGNPASAITTSGQVVRGHCLSLTRCPGWLIILASLSERSPASAGVLVHKLPDTSLAARLRAR